MHRLWSKPEKKRHWIGNGKTLSRTLDGTVVRPQHMALCRIHCCIAEPPARLSLYCTDLCRRFWIKYLFVLWICLHKRKRPGRTQSKDTHAPNTGPVLVKHNQPLDSVVQAQFRGGRGGVWKYAWFPATGRNQESGLNLGRMRTVCRTAPRLSYSLDDWEVTGTQCGCPVRMRGGLNLKSWQKKKACHRSNKAIQNLVKDG